VGRNQGDARFAQRRKDSVISEEEFGQHFDRAVSQIYDALDESLDFRAVISALLDTAVRIALSAGMRDEEWFDLCKTTVKAVHDERTRTATKRDPDSLN